MGLWDEKFRMVLSNLSFKCPNGHFGENLFECKSSVYDFFLIFDKKFASGVVKTAFYVPGWFFWENVWKKSRIKYIFGVWAWKSCWCYQNYTLRVEKTFWFFSRKFLVEKVFTGNWQTIGELSTFCYSEFTFLKYTKTQNNN